MADRPPLIGLPGRRKLAGMIDGFPSSFAGLDVDVYLADYGRAVIEAGGIPVNIPLDVDAPELMGHLDGLLLSGGTDVDPAIYHAARHPEVLGLEPERDELEVALYRAALDLRVPVLGICRGLQLMNVAHGGTLHQHVPEHSRYDLDVSQGSFGLRLDADSTLGALYGTEHAVNSLHHQTVDRVGDALTVTAWAHDGHVEGLELDRRTIAVQWHPELLAGRSTDPLFAWLVRAARESTTPE